MGSGQVLVWEGLGRSRPPRVAQSWVKQLVSTPHHWARIFIVRRQGPDGREGSTMNSTATCSTWRGMGSVRLYLARDSPYDENKQTYHTGSVAARVNKNRAFRYIYQDGGVKHATGASSKIRGRDNTGLGTWNTRTLRAAGKLQELTHEMDRYRWNIL